MRIDELGEFGLIARIQRMLPPPRRDVIVGIGDDVAVLEGSGGRVRLATCDVQMENIHFVRSFISPRDLGRKALAINLSDIAAKGGSPRHALVSLGLPSDLTVEYVDELYAGLGAEAELFETDIVGGNITRSPSGLFIDIFLLGDAPREQVILRSGARVGDRILVTGTLGDAAAAVAQLIDPTLGLAAGYAEFARDRLNVPTPRIRAGQLIGSWRCATAMLDVSDGLGSDLGHLCDASNVGAQLWAARLPVAAENRKASLVARGDEWHFALYGGEDYELLFAVPASQANALAESITHETGTRVSIIGEIVPPDSGRHVILPDERSLPLEPHGWDHLKR